VPCKKVKTKVLPEMTAAVMAGEAEALLAAGQSAEAAPVGVQVRATGLGEWLAEGEGEGLGEGLAIGLGEGLETGEGEGLAIGVGEGLAAGLGEAEGEVEPVEVV
jgi:hypothetical protein